MENKLEYCSAEIKSFEEDDGIIRTITGYASVFGNIDSHGDIIEKGSFSKTISDFHSRKINLYSSHSMDARDMLGSITDLYEDEYGLKFVASISSASSSQDLALKAKEGHLNEVSIGFYVREQEFKKDEYGNKIRYIKEIDLIEISLVSRASNPKATLLLVKQEDNKMSEEHKEELNLQPEEIKAEETVVEAKEETTNVEEKTAVENNELNELKAQLAELKNELNKPIKKTPHAVESKSIEKEVKMEYKAEDLFKDYASGKLSLKEIKKMALENKALASNIAANGGVLVPTKLEEEILVQRNQINRAQSRVRRMQVNGPIDLVDFSMGGTFPAYNENGTVTIDDISNEFGKNRLDAQQFTIIRKVSERLMDRSFENLMPFFAQEYGKLHANGLEQHILRGTGNNQPLGVVQLLDNLAVNTESVTAIANIDYDDMISMIMKLDEQYRSNAVILCHKDAMTRLMQLTDSQNLPVWGDAVGSNPATFRGIPVFESAALEDGNASGESPIIIGDFSQYILAEEKGFALEILDQLYAGNDQIGLKFKAAYDGMPIDYRAFARIEIA